MIFKLILLADSAVNTSPSNSAVNTSTTNSAVNTTPGPLVQIAAWAVTIVNSYIIPLMFAFAFLFFVAGIARYFILGQGNEEAQQKGKQMALYGIIGFVVIFGIWGIINFLLELLTSVGGVSNTFGGV